VRHELLLDRKGAAVLTRLHQDVAKPGEGRVGASGSSEMVVLEQRPRLFALSHRLPGLRQRVGHLVVSPILGQRLLQRLGGFLGPAEPHQALGLAAERLGIGSRVLLRRLETEERLRPPAGGHFVEPVEVQALTFLEILASAPQTPLAHQATDATRQIEGQRNRGPETDAGEHDLPQLHPDRQEERQGDGHELRVGRHHHQKQPRRQKDGGYEQQGAKAHRVLLVGPILRRARSAGSLRTGRFRVPTPGIAPELLELIQLAALRRENMDDEVHVVGEHPAGRRIPLEVDGLASDPLPDAAFHGVHDGAAAALASGGRDHEEIREPGETAQVEHHDVFGFFELRHLGGEASAGLGGGVRNAQR